MHCHLKHSDGCCFCFRKIICVYDQIRGILFDVSYVGVQHTPTNASFKNGGRSLSISKNNNWQLHITKTVCPKKHKTLYWLNCYLPRFRIIKKPRLKSFHCFQQFLRHVYCWVPVTRKLLCTVTEPKRNWINIKVPLDLF